MLLNHNSFIMKSFKTFITLLLVMVTWAAFSQSAPTKDFNQDKFSFEPFTPVKSFIENRGQYDGRTGLPGKIEYGVDYNGMQMYFTNSGFTYRFDRIIRNPERTKDKSHEPKRVCKSELANLNFKGANPNTTIMVSDKIQPYYSVAYYDKETGDMLNENYLSAYLTLTYKNIYNNIDVEYLSYPGKGIKYNLYLHPGADASQIQMLWEGIHTNIQGENVNFELTPEGHFRITGSMLDITELKPIAFYEDNNEPVNIAFTFDNNVLGFKLENYDNTRKLVIDPWIVSPVFTSSNAVWEVETDGAGNVYAIGGESPMKLNKYNSAGTLQWSYATPWDTAGYWLGTMATDNAGITYITAGVSPRIQKISTAGTMVWNNTGPNNSCEYWSITFNCDNTKLIVGGTYLPFIMGFDFSSAVYNINVSNGAVAGFQLFDTTSVMGIGTFPVEIRGISASRNAKYNFLTHNAVGLITQNIGSCPTNTPLYKVPLNYTLAYKCENYLPATQNGGGLKAIISNDNFVYTHSGNQIHKRNLSTGALITSVNIPSGQSGTTLGSLVVRNSGLDVDDCGNVYAGSMDRVVKFDQDLNILAETVTGFAVYDVSVNTNGEVIAVGAQSNNSAPNRNGKIQSINMSTCAQYDPLCCDATVCPAAPICHNAAPINLVANSPGGTWSGPGITNPSAGTFDPTVAGPGNHTVIYTLPCGSDSVIVVVIFCATLTPCQELNGQISVSGGTAPYTWQQWIPAGTITITNQAQCVACGYTWNALMSQCLNGFIPATSCNSPAQWSNFTTGTTITPPGTYPLQVLDSQGNSVTIQDFASLPACTNCPTLTITPSAITGVSCGGYADGSFNVTSSGGNGPYDYVLLQGGTVVASFNGITGPQAFTGLAGGSYILEVLDNDSCPGNILITITEPPAIDPGTPVVVDANCGQDNGSITISPSGGTAPYSYNWSTTPPQTTAAVANLGAGSYTVTITDANSCSVTTAITVNNIGGPTLQTTSTDAVCGQANGSATVTATGGSGTYTYSWSSTPVQTTATASNLAAGTYTVTVDDGTCIATAIVTINDISTGVTASVINIVADSCSNGVGGATAEVTGGTAPYTYAWSSTPPQTAATLQNVPAGTYTVTVTDATTCAITANVTIPGTPGLTAITTTTTETCGQGDGSATVIVTGGSGVYSYNWSNTETTSSINDLAAGNYTVTASDGTCTTTATANVGSTPGPTAGFSANPNVLTVSEGTVVFTDNSIGTIVNWEWNFGDNSPYGSGSQTAHQYTAIGDYVVTLLVTDMNGCTDTVSGLIRVLDDFTLYIPNAFTPDEDGLNDGFSPVGRNVDPESFEMYIFDRWGDVMYYTTEWDVYTAKEPWNGTKYNKGTRDDIVVGVYVYRINLKELEGIKHVFIGSVTLIK